MGSAEFSGREANDRRKETNHEGYSKDAPRSFDSPDGEPTFLTPDQTSASTHDHRRQKPPKTTIRIGNLANGAVILGAGSEVKQNPDGSYDVWTDDGKTHIHIGSIGEGKPMKGKDKYDEFAGFDDDYDEFAGFDGDYDEFAGFDDEPATYGSPFDGGRSHEFPAGFPFDNADDVPSRGADFVVGTDGETTAQPPYFSNEITGTNAEFGGDGFWVDGQHILPPDEPGTFRYDE